MMQLYIHLLQISAEPRLLPLATASNASAGWQRLRNHRRFVVLPALQPTDIPSVTGNIGRVVQASAGQITSASSQAKH